MFKRGENVANIEISGDFYKAAFGLKEKELSQPLASEESFYILQRKDFVDIAHAIITNCKGLYHLHTPTNGLAPALIEKK